jgi:hydroxymethylbilane synthase
MMLRIGTRKSDLALWQARYVQSRLQNLGIESELVEIESFGDKIQDIPLHKLGDKGVFTKALDIALVEGRIDLAVHSLKDIPTVLEHDLVLAAVPERENPFDVLVRPNTKNEDPSPRIVATGSIRRKALWLNKFPNDTVTDLRGNVPTRLGKVDNSNWHGAVFAAAGLQRLELEERVSEVLDWMLPAPSQGALGIVTKNDPEILEILKKIDDLAVRVCVESERLFLNTLEAGCSSPVAALAQPTADNTQIRFRGAVLSLDGSKKLDIDKSYPIDTFSSSVGKELAEELIELGALQIMNKE